ncbi:MAG: M16 family metallopeptidase [Nitrospiria bacterium]
MRTLKKHLYSGVFFILILQSFLFFSFRQEAIGAEMKPIRVVMPNGLTLLIVEQHSLPIVSVEVLVRSGSIYDPTGKSGLANLTAGLLDEGTAGRSAVEITDAVAGIGARLSVHASYDYVTTGLRVLKKDVEAGFELLSDILIHPAFDGKEVDRVRSMILGEILSEKDQPYAIARQAFRQMTFGSHPYHQSVKGSEESLSEITRTDLATFHQQYYRPNNAIISVVGDVTPQEAEALVQKFFGRWEKEAIAPLEVEPTPALRSKKVSKIDKDLSQATVMLGHVGIKRSNPDFYAVRVMNYILGGGGFSSRLMAEIRDNQGLVYSVYSRFSGNQAPGPFSVTFQTENRNARKAIEGVLLEINRIRDKEVSEKELAEAKAYLVGSFPLRIDTTRKVASLLPQIEFHKLGLDYFKAHAELLNRVTVADVRRVAKKYLHPDHYALVLVGRQKDIGLKE